MDKNLNQEAINVIDALGGPAETARLCDVSTAAVSQWKKNGIPKTQLRFLKSARPELFGIEEKRVLTFDVERRRKPGRRESDVRMGRRSRLPNNK
jgi:hypothetical protein